MGLIREGAPVTSGGLSKFAMRCLAARGRTTGTRWTEFEKKMGLDWSHPEKSTRRHLLESSEVESPREELAGDTSKIAGHRTLIRNWSWLDTHWKKCERKAQVRVIFYLFLVGITAKDGIKIWCKSHDEGLTLETSALYSLRWPIYIFNLVDITKLQSRCGLRFDP